MVKDVSKIITKKNHPYTYIKLPWSSTSEILSFRQKNLTTLPGNEIKFYYVNIGEKEQIVIVNSIKFHFAEDLNDHV